MMAILSIKKLEIKAITLKTRMVTIMMAGAGQVKCFITIHYPLECKKLVRNYAVDCVIHLRFDFYRLFKKN